MSPEEYAASVGADHHVSWGWGHLEHGLLVLCAKPHCPVPDDEHGLYTHWTVRSPWVRGERK